MSRKKETRVNLPDGSILVKDANLKEYPDALIFDRKDTSYLWCLHCHRAYQKSSFRIDTENELLMCPYPDCDGDYNLDGWHWSNFIEWYNYPVDPIEGVIYPHYPTDEDFVRLGIKTGSEGRR